MTEGYDAFDSGNFDPDDILNSTTSVTLFEIVFDRSGSVSSFLKSMNDAMKELFMVTFKGGHKAAEIMVKLITFDNVVEHKSGFRPITSLPDDYLHVPNTGDTTALYQATLEAFEHMDQYRAALEAQGASVRSNIFIITDGVDNASGDDVADKVKAHVERIRQHEWVNTYTVTVLGVGNRSQFEAACTEMGLDHTKCLVTTSTAVSDIRKVIGVVSESVSNSSTSSGVTF